MPFLPTNQQRQITEGRRTILVRKHFRLADDVAIHKTCCNLFTFVIHIAMVVATHPVTIKLRNSTSSANIPIKSSVLQFFNFFSANIFWRV